MYVMTDRNQVLVQIQDDSQWGFSLHDGDQNFPGGFGIASEWSAVEPETVSEADRERLQWVIDATDD